MRLPSLLAIAALLSAAVDSASAQQGRTRLTVNVERQVQQFTGTPYDGFLGVAPTWSPGYAVTVRRPSSGGGQHMLIMINTAGWIVHSSPQPAEAQATSNGIFDLAYDGQRFLYGGLKNSSTILCFDTQLQQWVPIRTIRATGLPSSVRSIRAIAWDPAGNGNRGTLWVSDASGAICELQVPNGNVLRTIDNPAGLVYGMALVPSTRRLWLWSQGGTGESSPNRGAIGVEVDLLTGLPTGQQLYGDASIAGSQPGGLAGGCDFVTLGGATDVVFLHQAFDDTLSVVDVGLEMHPGCRGRISHTGGGPIAGNGSFAVTLENANNVAHALLIGSELNPTRMPGLVSCDVNAPILDFVVGQGSGGRVRVDVPIPNGIRGAEVCFQWLQLGGLNYPLRASGIAGTMIY